MRSKRRSTATSSSPCADGDAPPPPGYPVTLLVDGRRCLVVGGGRIAARKAAGLLASGARVRVVAPEVTAAVRDLGVAVDERPYRRGDAAGHWLVVTATGDPELNAVVAADAADAGVWVNAADDPPACSFTLPAVLRRGTVSVAVSTGGRSPALAAALRDHLAVAVGPEWGTLAELLGAARERIHAAGRSTEQADWRAVVTSDNLELLRSGHIDVVRERIEAWLSSSSD